MIGFTRSDNTEKTVYTERVATVCVIILSYPKKILLILIQKQKNTEGGNVSLAFQ